MAGVTPSPHHCPELGRQCLGFPLFLKSGVVKVKCSTEEETELQSTVGCFQQEAQP